MQKQPWYTEKIYRTSNHDGKRKRAHLKGLRTFFFFLSETENTLIIIKMKRRVRDPSLKVQNLIKVKVYPPLF